MTTNENWDTLGKPLTEIRNLADGLEPGCAEEPRLSEPLSLIRACALTWSCAARRSTPLELPPRLAARPHQRHVSLHAIHLRIDRWVKG